MCFLVVEWSDSQKSTIQTYTLFDMSLLYMECKNIPHNMSYSALQLEL